MTPPSTAPISPREAQRLLAAGNAVLVDVREPDEHARERIAGTQLLPLGQCTPERLAALGAEVVLVHCKSGRRGADAVARCAGLGGRGVSVRNIEGGIEAWRGEGLPTTTDATRPRLGVMQQTQLVIGIALLVFTLLGAFLDPMFLAIPAFLGAGLVYAGASGNCGLSSLIARLPWNRAPGCAKVSCTLP